MKGSISGSSSHIFVSRLLHCDPQPVLGGREWIYPKTLYSVLCYNFVFEIGKNSVVKLYIIHTTKSKTGQKSSWLVRIPKRYLKTCLSVGGTLHMLSHIHGGNCIRTIDNLCLSEVGMGFFKDWENTGRRNYVPFYGKEVNFFDWKVFFFFFPKSKGGRRSEKGWQENHLLTNVLGQ